MPHTIKNNYHISFETDITASTTQTQAGATVLTANINEISTVANAADAVVLPSVAEGSENSVINNGANALQIFPAIGDNLGSGTNVSVSLAAGEVMEFVGLSDGASNSNTPAGMSAMSETPKAFGEMIEDHSTGSTIDTTLKLWITASVGELDSNGIITFERAVTGSKLTVGTGGAGTYQVHFSCSFTNANGNVVGAGIHLNGAEVGKLEDTHAGDSSEIRDLRGQGFLVLAVGDVLTLHVVSTTASDVITVYHTHVTIVRLT